jgi:4-amino-4-deoxy-L-arabinose transferase-like glycosyltransferase
VLGVGPYARREILLYMAPPLVPSLHRALFALFGERELAVNAAAALAGTATVLATWLAGRAWLGTSAALVAAAALAGMEYHLVFSRQALTDVYFTLFFTAALGSFFGGVERGRRPACAVAGVFAGATVLTKYHGFFAVAAMGIYAVARRWSRDAEARRSSAWRCWLCAALVAALPALWIAWQIESRVGIDEFRLHRRRWMEEPGLWMVPKTAEFAARAVSA